MDLNEEEMYDKLRAVLGDDKWAENLQAICMVLHTLQ